MPDFILRGRLDSTATVGAVILARVGIVMPPGIERLSVGVPVRTVTSWHRRFAERAPELVQRFDALCVEWGATLPFPPPSHATPTHHVACSIGEVWRAARRHRDSDLPPAWRLANVIVGSQLLATRVDLPWPIRTSMIGVSHSP